MSVRALFRAHGNDDDVMNRLHNLMDNQTVVTMSSLMFLMLMLFYSFGRQQ